MDTLKEHLTPKEIAELPYEKTKAVFKEGLHARNAEFRKDVAELYFKLTNAYPSMTRKQKTWKLRKDILSGLDFENKMDVTTATILHNQIDQGIEEAHRKLIKRL